MKKKKDKKKQRLLQISFAGVLLILAVGIEFVGMHPSGIYTYEKEGYKDFRIGLSKQDVLRQVNLTKTIRSVKTCDPESLTRKESRRKLLLSDLMVEADIWICHDRTGKTYLFMFNDDGLERILLQRLRFSNKQGSVLFSQCRADLLKDLDHYLATKETLRVYPEKR